ncbi:hypothetical protein [Magnetospirillum sulfuroxidans]|uniref:Uncharacterized protein n=1 Tax=Magnetospirillum sulfuroxidans TaxID=611300 RepID=A0ABS5I8N7_9PROT|nr:hypothetical protein [Magnetospirillum sulfuroxidans]MBR9970810.1 hypothetical protein [Magnetospirillum sulfuroxidans]
MAKGISQVFGFAYGRLDPDLVARSDLKAYYQGAAEALNVVPRSLTGLDRRPGLTWQAFLPEAASGFRWAAFEAGTNGRFMALFLPGILRIRKDGMTQVYENATVPWTADKLATLYWTQSADTMFIFAEGLSPYRLQRQGADTTWLLEQANWVNPPSWQFGADTTGTLTPGAKSGSGVTFSSSAGDFAAASTGWTVRTATGHGVITAKASSNSVTVDIKDPLENTDTVAAGEWSVEEPAWGAARGYPSVGTLREGRLHLGNSAGLPNHLWCTKAGKYFDFFGTDEANDDEAADLAFDDDEANLLYGLISADRLIAITSGGPWSVPDSPTTPNNYYARRIARLKCARGRPTELDGSVVFVSSDDDGAHQSLFELVYDEGSESRFICADLALYAATILRSPNPQEIVSRRGSATNTANYLYVPNRADGTLAVLHSRRSEKVTAWTLWQTEGEFLGALSLGNAVFFMVKRVIGGTLRYCLEKLDEAALADCSKTATSVPAQTTWTGFDHLEGHAVRVVADGAVAGTFTVTDGAIILPDPASKIEAGLRFAWEVKTMPAEAQLADGTLVGAKSRVWKAVVQVLETGALAINGRLIEHRRMGVSQLDAAPPLFTGEIQVRQLGWGSRQPIRISGDDLVPASILSVTIFLSATE